MKNKTDLRALKANHRLEMVMIDTGEKFETGPREWRSLTMQGLAVNLARQTYRIERPGQAAEEGDVFTWLQRRYGWSFGMAVRYLTNRKPDAPRNDQPEVSRKETRLEPAPRMGNVWEPGDKWQRKALKLAVDEIRDLFSPHVSSFEIIQFMSRWPARFLPLVDFSIDECEECGAEFDWDKPGTQCYLCQFYDYGGAEMPEDEQRLFILDNQNLTGFVCEKCKQEKGRYYLAMRYCLFSAGEREMRENEEQSVIAGRGAARYAYLGNAER